MAWNHAFFEIFETASGWWWYLRDKNHKILAQSAKHFETLMEAKENAYGLIEPLKEANRITNPLIGYLNRKEEKNEHRSKT